MLERREVGARIRHFREVRGLTLRELAFEGCTYDRLHRFETGEQRPPREILLEIARRLGVKPEQLTVPAASIPASVPWTGSLSQLSLPQRHRGAITLLGRADSSAGLSVDDRLDLLIAVVAPHLLVTE